VLQQHRHVTRVRFQSQQQQQQQASPPAPATFADVSIGGGAAFADGSAAAAMVSFLSAYGLDPPAIERLLQVRTHNGRRGGLGFGPWGKLV
jgi:hypothetical protein